MTVRQDTGTGRGLRFCERREVSEFLEEVQILVPSAFHTFPHRAANREKVKIQTPLRLLSNEPGTAARLEDFTEAREGMAQHACLRGHDPARVAVPRAGCGREVKSAASCGGSALAPPPRPAQVTLGRWPEGSPRRPSPPCSRSSPSPRPALLLPLRGARRPGCLFRRV